MQGEHVIATWGMGFAPPRQHGYDVVATIAAMAERRVRIFVGLGGNFATKLNCSHLIHARKALILPTLGRTEIDMHNGVPPGATVEDSMSMVHISFGLNQSALPDLLSEIVIVARMAEATLGNRHQLKWQAYRDDYALIRDDIEQVFDDLHDYNARVARPGGFHLMTTRSHDQYNTTIHAMDDRYRGVFGMRRVIFIHQADIALLGMQAGDWGDVHGVWDDGVQRRADGFMLVAYDIPLGCIGAYYPETNALVPLASMADGAGTPTYKSIPVLLTPAAAA